MRHEWRTCCKNYGVEIIKITKKRSKNAKKSRQKTRSKRKMAKNGNKQKSKFQNFWKNTSKIAIFCPRKKHREPETVVKQLEWSRKNLMVIPWYYVWFLCVLTITTLTKRLGGFESISVQSHCKTLKSWFWVLSGCFFAYFSAKRVFYSCCFVRRLFRDTYLLCCLTDCTWGTGAIRVGDL